MICLNRLVFTTKSKNYIVVNREELTIRTYYTVKYKYMISKYFFQKVADSSFLHINRGSYIPPYQYFLF